MKKKLLSLVLVGAMSTAMLAGCGNSSAPATDTQAPAADTQAPAADPAHETQAPAADNASAGGNTLSVYAWDPSFNIPALKAAEADYKANVDDTFSLNIIEQSQSSDVEQAITLAGSSGDYSQLPDIVLFQDHWIQKYVSDYPDAWMSVDDAEVDWSDFGAEKLSYSTVNGVHYGFPVDNGTVVMAYRVDILEECGYSIDDMKGISWDDFIKIGEEVYAKTGKIGRAHV